MPAMGQSQHKPRGNLSPCRRRMGRSPFQDYRKAADRSRRPYQIRDWTMLRIGFQVQAEVKEVLIISFSDSLFVFCAVISVILLLEFICKITYFILLLTFPWRLASPTSSLYPSDRGAGLAGAIIHSCAVLTHGRRGANMFAAPAGHWASFFVRCTGVVPREKAVEGALAQDLAFIAG